MDLVVLHDWLAERDEPAYRARQVWAWAARGAAGYEVMSNLPAGLRRELADAVPFSTLSLETYRLVEDRALGLAAANALGSLAAGLLAVYAGVVLGRAL